MSRSASLPAPSLGVVAGVACEDASFSCGCFADLRRYVDDGSEGDDSTWRDEIAADADRFVAPLAPPFVARPDARVAAHARGRVAGKRVKEKRGVVFEAEGGEIYANVPHDRVKTLAKPVCPDPKKTEARREYKKAKRAEQRCAAQRAAVREAAAPPAVVDASADETDEDEYAGRVCLGLPGGEAEPRRPRPKVDPERGPGRGPFPSPELARGLWAV